MNPMMSNMRINIVETDNYPSLRRLFALQPQTDYGRRGKFTHFAMTATVGALPATPFQQPTPICNETPHIVRTSWRNGENHGKQQGNHRCTGATLAVALVQ